jgi:hypothetical protein
MTRTALFGTITAFFMATGVEAATRVWVGGTGNNLWSTGANWQGGLSPVNGDRLVFTGGTASSFNDYPSLSAEALEIGGTNAYLFQGNPISMSGDTGLVINSSAQPITFQARVAFLSRNPRMVVRPGAGGQGAQVDFADVVVRGSLVVDAPSATLSFPTGIAPLLPPAGLDIIADVVRFGGSNTYDLDVNITARRFIATGESLARAKAVTYARAGSGLLEFTSPRPSVEQRYDLRGTAPGSGLRTFDAVLDEVYVDGIQVIDAARPLSLPGLLWGPGRIALEGGHRVTISGAENLFTGGLEVRDAVLSFGIANAMPEVNDLAIQGPKAILEAGDFEQRIRNFSCMGGGTLRWQPAGKPLEMTGSISVDGCQLDLSAFTGVPPAQEITLLQNDSGAPIVGRFVGLPEGKRVIVDGVERAVTYTGGGSHGDVALLSTFGLGRLVGTPSAPTLAVATGGTIAQPFDNVRALDVNGKPRTSVAFLAKITPAGCGVFPNGSDTMSLLGDTEGRVSAPAFTGLAYNRTCTLSLQPVAGGGNVSVDIVVYEPASLRLTYLADYALTQAGVPLSTAPVLAAGGVFGVRVPGIAISEEVHLGSGGRYDVMATAAGLSRTLQVTEVASVAARTRTGPAPELETITLLDGGSACSFTSAAFAAKTSAPPPPGWYFPRGMVTLGTSGCSGPLHFRSVDPARPARENGVYMRLGQNGWQAIEGQFDETNSAGFTFTTEGGTVAFAVPTAEYEDMWWAGPAENGWGMSVVQHRDTLFSVIYAYDGAGKPVWYVMPGGTWNAAHTAYTGPLYLPHGTPFFDYNVASFAPGSAVGTSTLRFADAGHATLEFTINGVSGSKPVTRQSFGDPKAYAPVRGDMWWGGASQNGWGIASLAQGAKLFSVWFTYDAAGAPTWFVMPDGAFSQGQRRYEGKLYRTRASAWLGVPYNAAQLQPIEVGTMRFDFSGDTARVEYSNEGHAGVLQLERQAF